MIEQFAPFRLRTLESRAVTQENPTGGKGLGGKDRGNGNCRKGAPAFRNVEAGETKTLCDIAGPGSSSTAMTATLRSAARGLKTTCVRAGA